MQNPKHLASTIVVMVLAVALPIWFPIEPDVSHASVTPPNSATVAVCGARDASDVEMYTGPAIPTSPVSREVITLGARVEEFRLLRGSPDSWYIKDGGTIRIYNASNNEPVSSFTISGVSVSWGFAVDSDGVYVANESSIYKYSNDGTQLWARTFAGDGQGNVYAYGTGADFRVAVSLSDGTSAVWNSDGAMQLANPIPWGLAIHYNAATNHISWSNGQEVAIYDATSMARIFYMGTDLDPLDKGPMHFSNGGGIEESGDGHYLVNDVNEGIRYFDSNGVYIANIKSDTYAFPNGSVDYQSTSGAKDIVHYDGKYYFMTGGAENAILSTLDDTMVSLLIQTPQATPFGLGIGAGPTTNTPGNYFRPGTTPQVSIEFYQWWAAEANQFTGQYSIRSIQQVKANQTVAPIRFSIPNTITGAYASVPVTLPSQAPGFYEMDVRISRGDAVVGADCLRYSIGAPGQTLDLTTLPGGQAREIALARQFGQKLFRSAYNMEDFLPDDPADTTPMDLSSIGAEVQEAADLAASNGVMYEMQLAEGGVREKAHVEAGRWQARVQEWVNYFGGRGVKAYEAWNEPNGGTYGDGTEFTNKVLKPFYNGVKAADPAAIVVGGGILGAAPEYFDQMLAAGAIDYMDVAGIHAYTGHNRSFEEEGIIDALKSYQPKFAAAGKPNMEIWDTESGFWNSDVNAYSKQDDKLIRKHILERSIGIGRMGNFYNDGGFTVNGLPWALLNGTELTPAGLASVVYKQYAADRPFLNWLTTGIPHTYAAEFGALDADSTHVVAIWADDYDIGVKPALSDGGNIAVSDQWGQTSTFIAGETLQLTGSVTYLKLPAEESLTLTPVETYGVNYANHAQGAVATASSNAKEGNNDFGLPAYAIDGISDTQNRGDNGAQISAWIQNISDSAPWLQVSFAQVRRINRIYVSSQGLGSVQQGLRSYDVQVDSGNGTFTTVAEVRNQFFDRNMLIHFPAQTVSKIKLVNMSSNYSGYGNGLPPSWWPTSFRTDDGLYGQVPVYEVEAYSPGETNEAIGGTDTSIGNDPTAGADTTVTSSASPSVPIPTAVDAGGPLAPSPEVSGLELVGGIAALLGSGILLMLRRRATGRRH